MSACPDPSSLDEVALGSAAPGVRDEVWAHAEGCSACGAVLGQLMKLYGSDRKPGGVSEDWALASTIASSPPTAEAPSAVEGATGERRLGRYRALERLGEGAMGEVFAAHDPELDRRVALKILHADPLVDPKAHAARLVREAKAMAKLAHPNVVTVYDVGVDRESGHVFVAMELVSGTTLGAWIKAKKRSPREVLDAFVQAGTGLAAAHAAGLVHRDFKPDNVLVGVDGRVRVGDFGLARSPDEGERVATTSPLARPDLTSTGAIVGTPAYMAPEQLRGEPADARTDQFAFAVALHEALYGERPFAGRTFTELRDAVLAGSHRGFEGREPRWLRPVFARALATRPDDRYPSMSALVAELARDRDRGKRRATWLFAVLAGFTVLVGTLLFVASRKGYVVGKAGPSCRDAPRRVDAVYSSPSSGESDAFRAKVKSLDAYADELRLAYVGACEASSLPPAPRDVRRSDCLEGRLRALAAAAKHAGDGGAVELPAIAICADERVLESDVEPPPSETARIEADRIRSELADIDEEIRSYDLRGANARALSALGDARKLAYDPVVAEALLRTAKLRQSSFRFREAKEALEEAVERARASKDDQVLFDATTELAFVIGVDLGRAAEADTWLGFARAESKRRPGDREGAAKLASVAGAVARRAGKPDEARKALESALALREDLAGSASLSVAEVLRELSAVRIELGDAAGALRDARRAADIVRTDVVASGGRESAAFALAFGEALLAAGQPRDALGELDRARTICATFGAESSAVALSAADALARARVALGEVDGARLGSNEALAGFLDEVDGALVFHDPRGAPRSSGAIDFAAKIRSKVNRPDDALSVTEAGAAAAMRAVEGDEPAARAALAAALANEEKNPSVESASLGALRYDEALLSLRAGDLSAASKAIEAAESALAVEVGPRHLRSAMAGLLHARILGKLGSPGAKDAARAASALLAARLGEHDAHVERARAIADGALDESAKAPPR